MRAAVPCLLLAACGFSTGGSLGPDDASVSGDGAIASGDSSISVDAVQIDATPDAAGCPTAFTTVANAGTSSKYQAFAKSSQLGAITTCSGLGTHLARLDTQAEADALEAFITGNSSQPTGVYRVVGARDPFLRSLWHDLDLSLLSFLPWGQNEPSDVFLGGEDCLVLTKEQGTAVIGAQECSSQHEFACECD